MATQRAKKKMARRREAILAAHVGESSPIRAVRVREVRVPCPACAHPSMKRRYLPVVGGASGSAQCPSCTVELPYEQVLAAAMGERVGAEVATLAPAATDRAEPPSVIGRDILAWFGTMVRQLLGRPRRWSFTTA